MDRAEAILSAIYDDVDNELNPNRDECWHCGGEGETWDCIDGCCEDQDYGCDDCRRPCPECRDHRRRRNRAVRDAVIETGDVDVVIAWLKESGRWHGGITREQVQTDLDTATAALKETEGADV